MSVHWKGLGIDQKIEAIKAVYEPGMSALHISAAIGDGVTRKAIIGMYWRHRDRLANCPLPPRSEAKPKQTPTKGTHRQSPRYVAGPMPQVAGVPLIMLGASQCRFPVNDAAKGDTHLFCGSKADGKWCGFHHGIVYRDPRTTGKDTHE